MFRDGRNKNPEAKGIQKGPEANGGTEGKIHTRPKVPTDPGKGKIQNVPNPKNQAKYKSNQSANPSTRGPKSRSKSGQGSGQFSQGGQSRWKDLPKVRSV